MKRLATSSDTVYTKVVDDFGGRLTRVNIGDLNSGKAKFTTSWGYNPFIKPKNLTWFEKEVDLDSGAATITDLIIAAKPRVESFITYVYALGHTGRLYKITTNSTSNGLVDTVALLTTLTASSPTFITGSSIEFFGATQKIYISASNQIQVVNFDGTGETALTSGSFTGVFLPLKQFLGKLYFGNGNNIGEIDSTGAVTTYTKLSPSLPKDTYIKDLDVTPDGRYLAITSSTVQSNEILTGSNGDTQNAAGSDSYVFRWNGVDAGITSFSALPATQLTATQILRTDEYQFGGDSFGMAVATNEQKQLTLPGNKPPFVNSTFSSENFVSWMTQEVVGSSTYGSLYYYGSLDSEIGAGLWRPLRTSTTLTSGFIYATPVNIMVNNKFSTVNQAATAVTIPGYGKHYFSTTDVNSSTAKWKLFRFLITPVGTNAPTLGVYETQNQIFSQRVAIKQVRVYTEPTVTSNGFQIDLIGSDGAVITNGTFTYSFSAGSDPTLLQGALERINFNPQMKEVYSLGVRITNTGTTNMTILKVEVDYSQAGE